MFKYCYLIALITSCAHASSLSPWSEKPLSTTDVSKNAFAKAIEAVKKDDITNALKNWYPQMTTDDQELLLDFIFQHKTPKDLSLEEMKLFESRILALRKTIADFASPLVINEEWKGALPNVFPVAQKIAPLAEEKIKKAELDVKKQYKHQVKIFEHEQPMYVPFALISADGVEVPMPRKVAQNCWVSKMLCDTLELDSKATYIETKVDTTTLKRMVYLMKVLAQLIGDQAPESTMTLARKKELVGTMFAKYLQVKSGDMPALRAATMPALLKAAHYLYSPLLEAAFARNYVLHLSNLRTAGEDFYPAITKEISLHNFPVPVLQSISKEAFLILDQNFDLELGLLPKHRTIISLDELKLWNKIPDDLLKAFPNLETNPQEERDFERGKNNAFEYVLTKMDEVSDQVKAQIITALTRLKKMDTCHPITIRNGDYLPVPYEYRCQMGIVTTLAREFLLRHQVRSTVALLRSGTVPHKTIHNDMMHAAVDYGNPGLIKLLAHLGANINDSNNTFNNTLRWTPLMRAVRNANLENVKALLELHPQVSAVNSTGETALIMGLTMLSPHRENRIGEEIVKAILPHVDLVLEIEIMDKKGMQKQSDMVSRYLKTGKFTQD